MVSELEPEHEWSAELIEHLEQAANIVNRYDLDPSSAVAVLLIKCGFRDRQYLSELLIRSD